ncbi:MAG TPA: hypothetical protein VGW78_07765 [Candidatus Babeliales bacterium]|jgi:hypothetical protein|nr:hypothetical protein [Candidatus Babeliales bacterium]
MTLSSATHFVSSSTPNAKGHTDNFIARYAERFQLYIDKDWTIRETKLHILQMFLNGSIYDNLQSFNQEYQGGNGAYVPLARRRPSTLYKLCEIIVNETVGMLFGDGHFPEVKCIEEGHKKTEEFLKYITNSCKIKRTMLNAAKEGSIGSVCILVKVLNGKFYFDVLNTKHLMPIFNQEAPDQLLKLIDHKKVDGSTLMSFGYEIPEKNKNKYYWLDREWDENNETYYKPYLVEEYETNKKREEDKERSSSHNFGFVPAIWIQNLPHAHHVDGFCTFEPIIDTQTEIDYLLSQTGRLLKYNSDPTLVVKNPSSLEGSKLIKSQTILNLDEKGDAYYAEMSGSSVSAVIEYVKLLREYGLESIRGNRSSPEKLNAAQSGRALQMLNNPLINLVDEMRLTYGDSGLLCLYSMCIKIYLANPKEIDCGGFEPDSDDCSDHLCLYWQDWYPATGQDKLQEAQAVQIYRGAGVISQETAINFVAEEFGIEDTENELSLIDKEKNEEQNRNMKMASVDRKPEKSSGS